MRHQKKPKPSFEEWFKKIARPRKGHSKRCYLTVPTHITKLPICGHERLLSDKPFELAKVSGNLWKHVKSGCEEVISIEDVEEKVSSNIHYPNYMGGGWGDWY